MEVMVPQHNVNVVNYGIVKTVTEPTLGGEGWGDGRK